MPVQHCFGRMGTGPRFRRLVSVFAVLTLSAVASLSIRPAQAQTDNTEAIVIQMPFDGEWAASGTARLKCGNDKCDSHPSYHDAQGKNWGTDLYGPDGRNLYFETGGKTGKHKFTVSVSGPTCAGYRVRINVSVDGKALGYVQYEHLDISGTNFTDGLSPGEFLGDIDDWDYPKAAGSPNWRCTSYQVSRPSGIHTHVVFQQSTRYACWTDYLKVGTNVSRNSPIGLLGSNRTTKGKCAAGASMSAFRNHLVQWTGDTNQQKTSWLVKSDVKRYWIPDTATYDCLKADGTPGPVRLQAKMLSLLTDATGQQAAC